MVLSDEEILVKDKTGKFKILRGGKFYDLEESAVVKSQTPASAVSSKVDEIIKQIRFRVDENLKSRLAEIIEAYLKDVRDQFETKNILIREKNNGGMGFLKEEADIVISLIDKIVSEKEKESVPKEALKEEAEKREEPRFPEKNTESHDDDREIALHKNKISQFVPPRNTTNFLKKVEEIIKESGVKLSEDEEKKLKDVLLTHLKNIRDNYELEDTLKNIFGNSFKKEDIKKIVEAAKKKSRDEEEDLRRKKLEEIKEALLAEQRRRENAFLDDKNKLNERLKNRWQEITKRKDTSPVSLPEERLPRPEKTAPEILSLVEFADFLDNEKNDQKEGPQDKKDEVIKAPAVPLLPPKTEPLKEPAAVKATASEKDVAEKEITAPKSNLPTVAPPHGLTETEKKADKPKPLQVFKPVNIPIRRPPPVFRKDQPRLDDIKYIPKIVGPIDELRDMTLINFRRLGETPEEAVEKIKEKLNILEHDSVIKRLAGIKAWQESEVVKIYLEISRDCLSKGASADQIISLRASSGKPTLTMEEYKAVLELNKFLRY